MNPLERSASHRASATLTTVALGLAAVLLTACQHDQGFRQLQRRSLGGTEALLTGAEHRVLISREANFERVGHAKPRDVVCAEPSPDVAKAFSTAVNIAGALEAVATLPEANIDGAVKLAASMSVARSEALAQLTNRLATIQLLRDGLYRACEAYANGALTDVTYAVLLSRYDDTMVTLLSGELVAGNFGQKLAVLGTAAGGAAAASAGAAGDVEEAQAELRQKNSALETARSDRDAATKALRDCEAQDPTCAERDARADAVASANRRVETAETDVQNALVASMGVASAATTSNARAIIAEAAGSGGADRSGADFAAVGGSLQRVHQKFLENINGDAIVVACLTEMAGGRADSTSQLARLCTDFMPVYLQEQADILRIKVTPGPGGFLKGCQTLIEKSLTFVSEERDVPNGLAAAVQHCTDKMPEAIELQFDLSTVGAETRRLRAERAAGEAWAEARLAEAAASTSRRDALRAEEALERTRLEAQRFAREPVGSPPAVSTGP